MLKNYLMVFFVSMVPVIELRGAIPIGLGMGLPALPTYLVCVLGNMLPCCSLWGSRCPAPVPGPARWQPPFWT